MSKATAIVALGAASLAAALGGACQPDDADPSAARARTAFGWREKPNVLLVVVDTLRKDHLQPYGYTTHPTTPALQRFSDEARVVDGLTCVSSWTMPSMATLFTGLAPSDHGVMRLVGEHSRLGTADTLAQRFRAAGYATGCVMSNFLLSKRRNVGFEAGFDWYDDSLADREDPHAGTTSAAVADLGLGWIREREVGQPWFLVLHFFDPHTSYEEHPDPAIDFADPDYDGWVRPGLSNDAYREHQESTTEADRRQLAAYYDEEIRNVDDAFGRVIEGLRAREDWSDTLVVFTSDHGEELAERGMIGHTRTLHFEQIDLPLIVRFPDPDPEWTADRTWIRRGRDGFVSRWSQQELPGAIQAWCGLASSAEDEARAESVLIRHTRVEDADLEGESEGGPSWLDPFATPFAVEVDFAPIRVEHPEKFVRKRAIVHGTWKLVRDRNTGTNQLFDLGEDASEHVDLSADEAHEDVLRQLEAMLEEGSWWEAPE